MGDTIHTSYIDGFIVPHYSLHTVAHSTRKDVPHYTPPRRRAVATRAFACTYHLPVSSRKMIKDNG